MKRQRSLLFVYATVFGSAVLGGYLQIKASERQIYAQGQVEISDVVATSSAAVAPAVPALNSAIADAKPVAPALVEAPETDADASDFIVEASASGPVPETPFVMPEAPAAPQLALPASIQAALPDVAATLNAAQPAVPTATVDDASNSEADNAQPADLVASCAIDLIAVPAPDAMVDLQLQAPCLPDARFTLHHDGVMFSDITDVNGAWSATVPAMTVAASFIAAFDNGEGAATSVTVPDVASHHRVALQWTGDAAFSLHAAIDGAGFNQAGHVWRGSQDTTWASVTPLGARDVPMTRQVEIFSAPHANIQDRSFELAIEAQVTSTTCTQDVSARVSQKMPRTGVLKERDVMFSMPGCDSIGEYLLLKNASETLTFASNP